MLKFHAVHTVSQEFVSFKWKRELYHFLRFKSSTKFIYKIDETNNIYSEEINNCNQCRGIDTNKRHLDIPSNRSKSCMTSMTTLQFLDVEINSKILIFSLPKEKKDKVNNSHCSSNGTSLVWSYATAADHYYYYYYYYYYHYYFHF